MHKLGDHVLTVLRRLGCLLALVPGTGCTLTPFCDFPQYAEQCADRLEVSFSQVKQFNFEWTPVTGAQYYQLFENADWNESFVPIGGEMTGLSTSLTVPLHLRNTASYKVAGCNAAGCTESQILHIGSFDFGVMGSPSEAVGYFKASNPDSYDHFGDSVALSADGSTLAVGASGEDSSATGIGGAQADNSTPDAGAVYVFVRDGQGGWSQQAYVKASNCDANDRFGASVTLSADGNALAVGAPQESSGATGIDGDQADDSTTGAGAVYVFVRNQGAWSQQAYVKASNSGEGDFFGDVVALSGDGSTLAVGAPGEASNATGIDGDQADNSSSDAGAVYVFVRDDQDAWSQQAYVKASNSDMMDAFGTRVALRDDGRTLAVSAPYERSSATGVNGNQDDNSVDAAGAVYVFVRNQGVWAQQAYVKASNTAVGNQFGLSLALSGYGSTLAIGSFDSGDRGVHVFVRDQNAWSQQVYQAGGLGVALSGDGSILAIGDLIGAERVNVLISDDAWSQGVDHFGGANAPNPDADDYFGSSLALSGDGWTLAVGAYGEDSNATGVSGDQTNNSASEAGAVYLY